MVLGEQNIEHSQRGEARVPNELDGLESLSRRAHPRAQRAGVRGCLMVNMVGGVGDSLRIDEGAQEQEADGQTDRNET